MKLYNTLTRQIEPLKPLKPGHIKLYTCGPTVYHYFHIGNLRNAVFNDMLKRVLKRNEFTVDHVMNITDVGHLSSDADSGDDKLQSRANEEGKTVWEVAEFYTEAFNQDMRALNILQPDKLVRATAAIENQIKMVDKLLKKDFAYTAQQAIYFDVSKLDDYGKLTGQRLSQKEVAARAEVVTDPEKRNPQDFALWFFTVGHFAHHAMRWQSPWGEGFPGWHLECSAIIEQELGPTIDIHTGGVDLIGTHHTNEIAQSEAVHDNAPLASLWVHIEFLLVDGAKMSKSLRNTFTLSDIVKRGYDPMALRLLYLQSHYRTQQNFTWEALEAAKNLFQRLGGWADGQFQNGRSTLSDENFTSILHSITTALQNDLATPEALRHLITLVDRAEAGEMPTAEQVATIEQIVGLRLDHRADITTEQKALLNEREAARQSKDYVVADRARAELRKHGLEIDDTPFGQRWHRSS